jgi:hypothetical protein
MASGDDFLVFRYSMGRAQCIGVVKWRATNRKRIPRRQLMRPKWATLEIVFSWIGSYHAQGGSRGPGIRPYNPASGGSSGKSVVIAGDYFNATAGMHGAGTGTGNLSKGDEIHIKRASIVASWQQSGAATSARTAHSSKTLVYMIAIDDGHFTLKSHQSAQSAPNEARSAPCLTRAEVEWSKPF